LIAPTVQQSNRLALLKQVPFLAPLITPYKLLLYGYPGRLRAILPLHHVDSPNSPIGDVYASVHGIRYDFENFSISPDGHRVALLCKDPQQHQVLLVYKW
jgi:hypothetical protein